MGRRRPQIQNLQKTYAILGNEQSELRHNEPHWGGPRPFMASQCGE